VAVFPIISSGFFSRSESQWKQIPRGCGGGVLVPVDSGECREEGLVELKVVLEIRLVDPPSKWWCRDPRSRFVITPGLVYTNPIFLPSQPVSRARAPFRDLLSTPGTAGTAEGIKAFASSPLFLTLYTGTPGNVKQGHGQDRLGQFRPLQLRPGGSALPPSSVGTNSCKKPEFFIDIFLGLFVYFFVL